MNKELKEKIIAFLSFNKSKLGVVGTINDHGKPESAALYYTFDGDLNIYFATKDSTRKYKNILKNENVSFVVVTEEPPQTLQIEGVASVHGDVGDQKHLFEELVGLASFKHFSAPINQQPAGGLQFVKITPTWLRFGNFEVRKHGDTFEEVKL